MVKLRRKHEPPPQLIPLSLAIQEVAQLPRASLPSTVVLHLDLQPDDRDRGVADPTKIHQVLLNLCANAAAARRAGGGERLLLVDDENTIGDMLGRYLTAPGYQVGSATAGEAALARLREADGAFDLLITDQTMPRRCGTDLTRAALERWPGLPVILLTGFSTLVSAAEARRLGIRHYLTTPFRPQELAAVVRRLLDARDQATPASELALTP